jgi:hypothetical protein
LQRRHKPPLDVQQDPPPVGVDVLGHRPNNQLVVQAVEEGLDVQVDDPVRLPAALPAHPHRVQRRPARPVPVGIGVEHRFHLRLQVQAHDRLGDPVRDRGHAKDSDPTAVLGDLHRTHRRREVAPRRQPIPELVEVAFQVNLELRHRPLLDPRRSLVRLDPPIGLPHHPLGDGKRLWFAHLGSSQPHGAGWPPSKPR